ncbi:MAG: DUF420 domain-containing protein [Balneolales bacterium]
MPTDIRSRITIDALKNTSVYKAIILIILVSALAFLFLVWLLYYQQGIEYSSDIIANLPALNASLNAISTTMLLFGYYYILQRKFEIHMRFMVAAFASSTLFLISYVIYHTFQGHTLFEGTGFIRPVYFSILISHIILSAAVVPLVLSSFYFAFAGRFKVHRKLSRFTFPVWLYVSVTGVLIFLINNAY